MSRKETQIRKQSSETQLPILIAYHVAERGDESYWTRVGAAWDHKDGEGFTLQLNLVPTDGGRIVLRPPQDNEDK